LWETFSETYIFFLFNIFHEEIQVELIRSNFIYP
jgi:hypothetical protein